VDAASVLRRARRAAGLTQQALAARTGTSQAAISAYENGSKEPSLGTLSRLLSATGHELRLGRSTPIRVPSRQEQARVARTLLDVLELAAALPTRHQLELRYPRLPAESAQP